MHSISGSTTFLLSLGLVKYWQVFEEKWWSSQLYHATLSLLVLIITLNLFISLINETYEHVRTAKMYEYDAELLDYAWKRVKGIVHMIGILNDKGKSLFQPASNLSVCELWSLTRQAIKHVKRSRCETY